MSNVKHTPGPWSWHKEGVNFKSLLSEARAVICLDDVYPGYPECGQDLVMEMNAEDACLIATAPELLDTLRKILNAHDSKNNGACMGEAVLCPMFADMARAAIAKAEGL